jgi:hypothetical protein
MNERYVEAPFEYVPNPGDLSLFLAGGITDCPDWQQWLRVRLADSELVILNPRRADFPIDDPNAAFEQIRWEYKHLRLATAISFWFCDRTLNPIVLYELGAWSMTNKPIFVALDPDYERRADVEVQTELARPDVRIVYSLEELARQIEQWFKETSKMKPE